MTNAEVELPFSTVCGATGHSPGIFSPLRGHSTSTVDVENALGKDFEKDFEKDEEMDFKRRSPSFDDGDSSDPSVVEHYLTFETELPAPSTLRLGLPAKDVPPPPPPPPPPPDLNAFISPFSWPRSRKDLIIWLSCTATTITAFTAGSYSPGIAQMEAEWHISSVAALVGITTFTMGFAVAPMVLAPFSEINGRKPVFIVTGVLFVLCQLCCAVTRSFAGMLLARFFVGVGGSTFSTMVGGVVSDIYHTADRNTPMALFSGAALMGTGLGPLVCGFVAQHTTWRWIFYLQTIVDGAVIFIISITFRETRGSVLLSRKAKALNRWYADREAAGFFFVDMPVGSSESSLNDPSQTAPQRIRWKVKSDEERASLAKMISISLYRPFHLLVTESVVFFFSLWVSFSWAVLYLTIAAIPLVFRAVHHFSLEQQNSIFASMSVGAILATLLSIYQDKIAFHFWPEWSRKHLDPATAPEARIYFSCIESTLLPIGLFIFGWTARPDIHWIAPAIAVCLATMGIFSIYLAVFNYLADTYHRYASSALAAQSFCRNVLGGIFPLVTIQLYDNLGFGPASSLLGVIGTLLTLVPWVLLIWGPKIRARSKFASELVAR